jgi:hypothetical protein
VGDRALGRHLAGDIHVVLDGDRDAGQAPVLGSGVDGVGGGQRRLGEHDAERVEHGIVVRDPRQGQLRELARGHLPAAYELRLRGDAREGDVGGLH